MATFDPHVPFSRAQARAAGITDHALRGAKYQRLFHDVYVAAHVRVTPRLLGAAALTMVQRGSRVSHVTAAQIWGGVVPDRAEVDVSVPSPFRPSRRRGIRARRLDPQAEAVSHGGLLMSSARQTFLDLADELGLVELVVLGDSLVARGRTTPAELTAAADEWLGGGAVLARRAARLVRAGVDSPARTRLRLLLVLAGLPEPAVNHTVRGSRGSRQRRFDLCYPDLRLIVEHAEWQQAQDDAQRRSDRVRREWLDGQGWRIVVIRWDGLDVRPEQTLRRVHRALLERGARGLPKRWDEEWRRHFPGCPQSSGALTSECAARSR